MAISMAESDRDMADSQAESDRDSAVSMAASDRDMALSQAVSDRDSAYSSAEMDYDSALSSASQALDEATQQAQSTLDQATSSIEMSREETESDAWNTYQNTVAEAWNTLVSYESSLPNDALYDGLNLVLDSLVESDNSSESGVVNSSGQDDYHVNVSGVFAASSSQNLAPGTTVTTRTGEQSDDQSRWNGYQQLSFYSGASSRYLQGSYAAGSYSFGSVVLSDSGSQTATSTESATWSESSSETITSVTDYDDVDAVTLLGSDQRAGLTSGTVEGTFTSTQTSTDSSLGTQNSSEGYASYQEGSFGGFAYNLGCVVFQENSSSDYTSTESSSDDWQTSATSSYTLTTQFSQPQGINNPSITDWGSATRTGDGSSLASGTDSSTEDSSGHDSSSRYQAGVFQGSFYSLSSVALFDFSSAASSYTTGSSSGEDSSDSWSETGTYLETGDLVFFDAEQNDAYGSRDYTRWSTDTFTSSSNETAAGSESWQESFAQQGSFGPVGYSLSCVVYQAQSSDSSSGQLSGSEQAGSSGGETYLSSGSGTLATTSVTASYVQTGDSSFQRSREAGFTYSYQHEDTATSYEAGGQAFDYALSSLLYQVNATDTFSSVEYSTSTEVETSNATRTQSQSESSTQTQGDDVGVRTSTFSKTSNTHASLTCLSDQDVQRDGTAQTSWTLAGTLGSGGYQFSQIVYETSGSGQDSLSCFAFASYTADGSSQQTSSNSIQTTSNSSMESTTSNNSSTLGTVTLSGSSFSDSGWQSQTLDDDVDRSFSGHETGSQVGGVRNLDSVTFQQSSLHSYTVADDLWQGHGGTTSLGTTVTLTSLGSGSSDDGSSGLSTWSSSSSLSTVDGSSQVYTQGQTVNRGEYGNDLESYTLHGSAAAGVYNFPTVVKESLANNDSTYDLLATSSLTGTFVHNESRTSTVSTTSSTGSSTNSVSYSSQHLESTRGQETTTVEGHAGSSITLLQEGAFANDSFAASVSSYALDAYENSTRLSLSTLHGTGQDTVSNGTLSQGLGTYINSSQSQQGSFTNDTTQTLSADSTLAYSLVRDSAGGSDSFTFDSSQTGSSSLDLVVNGTSGQSAQTSLSLTSSVWNGYQGGTFVSNGCYVQTALSSYISSRTDDYTLEQRAQDSFTLHQQSDNSGGTLALSSIVLQAHLEQSSKAWRDSSLTEDGSSAQTVVVSKPDFGGSTTANSNTFHSERTSDRYDSSSSSLTLYQAGVYAGESLSLTSFVQDSDQGGTLCLLSVTEQSGTQTSTALLSGALAVPPTWQDSLRLSSTTVQRGSSMATLSLHGTLTYHEHQAGTYQGSYQGGSFSLDSLVLDVKTSGNQDVSQSSLTTITSWGTETGYHRVGNAVNELDHFQGTGLFTENRQQTLTSRDYREFSLKRHEEGQTTSGLSLSCVSLRANSSDDRSQHQESNASSTFHGTGDPESLSPDYVATVNNIYHAAEDAANALYATATSTAWSDYSTVEDLIWDDYDTAVDEADADYDTYVAPYLQDYDDTFAYYQANPEDEQAEAAYYAAETALADAVTQAHSDHDAAVSEAQCNRDADLSQAVQTRDSAIAAAATVRDNSIAAAQADLEAALGPYAYEHLETVTSSLTLDEKVNSLLTLSGASGNISALLSLTATASFNADKGDRSQWNGGGHVGLDSFTATTSGHSDMTLTSDGVYGGAGSFTLTGGAWGSMHSDEVGSWSMTSTGGFTHTRDWQGTQSMTKSGTYGSSGEASFGTYQVGSLSTLNSFDSAMGTSITSMSYSQQSITGTGTSGTLSGTYHSEGNAGGSFQSITQPSSSTLTLSFPVSSLRFPGPVTAGQLAVSEPAREGQSLYQMDVKLPLAAPLWVAADPPELLRGTEGWWLQVRGAAMGEPTQALTIQVGSPTPPEVPPGTPEGSSGPGLPGLWSWLGQEATDAYVAQGPGIHAGAWSMWIDAAPSSDAFLSAVRNPPSPLPPPGWLADAATPAWLFSSRTFSSSLTVGSVGLRALATDGETVAETLLFGVGELMGLVSRQDREYNVAHNVADQALGVVGGMLAKATADYIRFVGNAGLFVLMFTAPPLALAFQATNHLAEQDYLGLGIDVVAYMSFNLLGMVGQALKMSKWALGTRVVTKFAAGAVTGVALDLAYQYNAIARGKQQQYNKNEVVFAGLLSGTFSALFVQTKPAPTARLAQSEGQSGLFFSRRKRIGHPRPEPGDLGTTRLGQPQYTRYESPFLRWIPGLRRVTYPEAQKAVRSSLQGAARRGVEAHEARHIADLKRFPQLFHLARSYVPGRGIANYIIEYRGYAAEYGRRLINPLRPLDSMNPLSIGYLTGEVVGIVYIAGRAGGIWGGGD
jgi:hypothetical protein